MARFAAWNELPELEPPKDVASSDAVRLACNTSGTWRGAALYVYENAGWSIFEDLSGHCSAIPAENWQRLAKCDDFVFAGYNDAIGYGELIVIQNGQVLREFLSDKNNPETNVNRGELVGSDLEPIKSWVEAASFVDSDELVLSERGLLWLHGTSA